MRSYLRLLSAACLAASVFWLSFPQAEAQDPATKASDEAIATDQKLISEIRSNQQIMKNLQFISDVIGPRVTGSPALKKANDWTAEKLKSYGLDNVHLEAWEIPTGWERGTATMKIVEPDNGKYLTVASRAWTPGTNGKVTGEVVLFEAKNRDDLAKYKGKLKNAVILRGAPQELRPITDMTRTPTPAPKEGAQPKRGFGKRGSDGAKKDEKKTEEGKKDEQPKDRPAVRPEGFRASQEFQREVSEFLKAEGAAVTLSDSMKPHGLLNMTGNWAGRDRADAGEPLPNLFITNDHYALLYRLATRKDAPPTKVEVEISNKTIPGPVPVYNTVGEILGSEKPDEIVIVGAHLDSWDLGTGTTDNGTGSSVIMEVARAIKATGLKPKRTIRFVLFTGEEQGLHGSKAYVERHKAEMPKHSVALVHDTGTGKVLGLGLQGRPAVKKVMDPMCESLKPLGFEGLSLRGMGGTDHLSFEAVGVPGFACSQDPAEYRLTHHSQSDTFDKAKKDDLVEGAQVLAVLAVRLANMDGLLTREKAEDNSRTSGVKHRFLAADNSKGKVRIIGADGKTEWEYDNKHDCHDLQMLPNGNILMPVSATKIVEVDKDKKTVWEYTSKPKEGYTGRIEVHAFQRLSDGNTMIAESGNGRIVEVDKDGKIVKTIPLTINKPHPHRDTRMARKLDNGNYLVCHEADGTVREYDGTGKVVWSYKIDLAGRPEAPGHGVEGHGDSLYGAIRLPNGNTLIAGGNNNRVLEVTPEGKIAWQIDQDELPGIKLAWVTSLHYLPSGNIVVGNCHAGPENPQLFEVTKDKKIVWKMLDFERFGNSMPMAVILDAEKAIR